MRTMAISGSPMFPGILLHGNGVRSPPGSLSAGFSVRSGLGIGPVAIARDLEQTVALVTGPRAASARRPHEALAARGATVALVARRADRLEELGGEIADGGGTALPIEADVSDREQARRRSPARSRSWDGSTSSSTTPA